MPYDPQRHRRRSIRLKGYDYSQRGAYFITLVTYQRHCLFGEISGGAMILNPIGMIVAEEWEKTAIIRPEISLDEYIIMPNHVHGIILINVTDQVGATRRVAPTTPHGPARGSIGAIVGEVKSVTAKQINAIRGTPGAPVWQRNYYEHVIRDEAELRRVREYIRDNPLRWESDRENPARVLAKGKGI